MFEHRTQPLLSTLAFLLRMVRSVGVAVGVVLVSLALGVLGYHEFEGQPWIDALVNASMILSGMGPVDQLHTSGGKVFAAVYALFSGFRFLTIAAILLGPVFHRMIHRFHLEAAEEAAAEQR